MGRRASTSCSAVARRTGCETRRPAASAAVPVVLGGLVYTGLNLLGVIVSTQQRAVEPPTSR